MHPTRAIAKPSVRVQRGGVRTDILNDEADARVCGKIVIRRDHSHNITGATMTLKRLSMLEIDGPRDKDHPLFLATSRGLHYDHNHHDMSSCTYKVGPRGDSHKKIKVIVWTSNSQATIQNSGKRRQGKGMATLQSYKHGDGWSYDVALDLCLYAKWLSSASYLAELVQVFNVALSDFSSKVVYKWLARCLPRLPNLHTFEILLFPTYTRNPYVIDSVCADHFQEAFSEMKSLTRVHTLTLPKHLLRLIDMKRAFPALRHIAIHRMGILSLYDICPGAESILGVFGCLNLAFRDGAQVFYRVGGRVAVWPWTCGRVQGRVGRVEGTLS
ncbi:hypothetical protein CPB85DRAFT_1261911, partial [Mucidula mucida]